MLSRIGIIIFASALAFGAAKTKKITGAARGENQDLILNVTIYADVESVKNVVGDDLGGHFIVAEVKVEPKYGKEIVIDRDDFALRTDKNGEKSRPMAPSQIAGRGSLVVTRTNGPGGLGAEPTRGWSLGGIGMGSGGGVGAGGGAGPSGAQAKMEQGEKENPLKKVLDEKVLPEKKVEEPVTGLLFFPMEGQKLKDLEMIFGAKENRIGMRFKEVK
jgi:hypothetical protein